MCGINGMIKRTDYVREEELRLMSSAITHRGPDEAGFMISRDGKVGLSNLRLSIMDIKNGQQPMYNEDNSIAIVFNGEIYDTKEHRRNLEAQGHIFRTTCDTEVLIHMYEEYGMSLLDKINGEYAFIIWDSNKRKMYAVRDCFGIKPLFYYHNDNEVLLSSEMKGILALDRVERKLDSNYLLATFMTFYSQTDTVIQGIRSIKPGSYLEISEDGQLKEITYWRPDFTEDTNITFDEAKEGVRYYLEKAVKRRMIADVPTAVYLSGGIDSTLVCGIMSKYQNNLKAFNIGFTEEMFDESGYAKMTADYYSVDFTSLKCTMDMMAQGLEQTLYHTESIISNPHSIAKCQLSKLARSSGYKVCLTGEGSDEFFAGYPYFKLENLWRHAEQKDLDESELKKRLEEFYKSEASSENAMWDRNGIERDKNHILKYPNYFYHRGNGSHDDLVRSFNKELFGEGINSTTEEIFSRNYDVNYIKELSPLNATRFISLNQMYAYIIPILGDRAEMMNSIEGRVPFLDRELVQFVSKLPSEYLLRTMDGFKEKYVLRKAFEDMVPPHMKGRKKHTFLSPSWGDLLDTEHGTQLKYEYLESNAIKQNELFDFESVRNVVLGREMLSAEERREKSIDIAVGMILSVQILNKYFIKSSINADSNFEMVNRSLN